MRFLPQLHGIYPFQQLQLNLYLDQFHITPFVINIGTTIPKATFRFENFWADHKDFLKVVELHWNNTPFYANSARSLSQKLKQVRSGLKAWSKCFSNLGKLVHNCNWVLLLLDGLEEKRSLSPWKSLSGN